MLSPSRLLLTLLAAGTCVAFVPSAFSEPALPLPLETALQKTMLRAEISGNSRDQLRLSISNTSPEAVRIAIPAGLILKASNGDRVIVLRSAEITVASRGTADVELPTAALSSRNGTTTQPFTVTRDAEPRLAGLLRFLASHDDIPRATSQLLVLAVLENTTFEQWQKFLALQRAPDASTSRETIHAIDVLGLLREISPAEQFALARDNELKLRALRNPVTRAKAAQLYGLALPEEPGIPQGGTPNLKQLLHTQAGDNCPTCRMREQAGRGAGDF